MGEQTMVRPDRPDLEGWTQIAGALGVREATARRWGLAGMPVYNFGPKRVVAYTREVMAWALKRREARAA